MIQQTLDHIAISKFTYVGSTNSLVTEISDLGNFKPGQIYDDACDEGFIIDGNYGSFVVYLSETVRNETEIVSWKFKAINEFVKFRPELKDLTIIIFND